MFLKISHKKHQLHGNAGANKGSALLIAIFIIVVMSILALSLTKNIASSASQVNNEVMGTRARLAAEAGNEKILAQLFSVTGSSSCIASQQMYLTSAGFAQCAVRSTCTEHSHNGTSYYAISSTGVCKTGLAGNNSSVVSTDTTCLSSDNVCVSRTLESEAKAL